MFPDYRPTATMDQLRQRADLLRQTRGFFDRHGFDEVQVPCLSADSVVDVYLDPVVVDSAALALPTLQLPNHLYLQTSPEFLMKRLLAAGAEAIYQIGPAFRGGERGPLHNPEFTMLEWYRAGDTAGDAIDFVDEFSQQLLGTSPSLRVTYQRAFLETVNIDPLAAELHELREVASSRVCEAVGLSCDRDGWLSAIFAFVVQPAISAERSCIVTHFPASQAALACQSQNDPRTAERFEWFVDGIELGNGYEELLDAEELLRRSNANNRQRVSEGREALPLDSRLIAAMQHGLPKCAGVAVGFDRLTMVRYGLKDINQALPFPIERA